MKLMKGFTDGRTITSITDITGQRFEVKHGETGPRSITNGHPFVEGAFVVTYSDGATAIIPEACVANIAFSRQK